MAKTPNMPSMNRETRNIVRDSHGRVILAFDANDYFIFNDDRSVTRRRINENIQLVCGRLYNPAMSMGKDPVLLLSGCETCRNPRPSLFRREIPSHGLCSTEAGHLCYDCREFLCPRHAVRCRDRRWRCAGCARKHSWTSALIYIARRMFFKREDA